MGQSSSTGAAVHPRFTPTNHPDYISNIPDECLASIFHFLGSGDRKRCSLVSHRWLQVEAQSRHRLSLNAKSDLFPYIPSLFSRFHSLTKLALKCERKSPSITDDALILISLKSPKLTRLKLRGCRQLTHTGLSIFAKNSKSLKKLSLGSSTFGAKGINALLQNSPSLEELSVKRLRGISHGITAEPIGPAVVSSSLKSIRLKELYNGQCFGPLIIGSKNLKMLKLFRCSGDWDKLLQVITERVNGLVEVHLDRVQVSDAGLVALSNCSHLETLHIVKTPECTNEGVKYVAERCKLLRKLHIDGWKMNRIGDEGLNAVAKHCVKLQELVLIGVNPTRASLERLATDCLNLERFALCGSDSVGDAEISCFLVKCVALRKLCIKSCPVSDHCLEAIARGCPNLVKVKIKKCRAVTPEGADWLRASRQSLVVNLDMNEPENQEGSASDSAQEGVITTQPELVEVGGTNSNTASRVPGRSVSFKARVGLIAGRNVVACTLRRWSSFSGSSRNN